MAETYYKQRNDFSESHYKLPNQYGMFDIDVMFGEWLNLTDIKSTKPESTYIEYRCLRHDKDGNRFNEDVIKYVALFELKYKMTDRIREEAKMIPGRPLWAAFMTAKRLNCRFFLVVASEGKSPFAFHEFCTKENKRLEKRVLEFDYLTDDAEIIRMFWNNELNICK